MLLLIWSLPCCHCPIIVSHVEVEVEVDIVIMTVSVTVTWWLRSVRPVLLDTRYYYYLVVRLVVYILQPLAAGARHSMCGQFVWLSESCYLWTYLLQQCLIFTSIQQCPAATQQSSYTMQERQPLTSSMTHMSIEQPIRSFRWHNVQMTRHDYDLMTKYQYNSLAS